MQVNIAIFMHQSNERTVAGKSEMACCCSRHRKRKGKVLHITTVTVFYQYLSYIDTLVSLIQYANVCMKVSFNFSDKEELVKISKEEKLAHTPADMTGNELDFNQKRRKKNQESNDKIFGYDGEDGNDELGFEENEYP